MINKCKLQHSILHKGNYVFWIYVSDILPKFWPMPQQYCFHIAFMVATLS